MWCDILNLHTYTIQHIPIYIPICTCIVYECSHIMQHHHKYSEYLDYKSATMEFGSRDERLFKIACTQHPYKNVRHVAIGVTRQSNAYVFFISIILTYIVSLLVRKKYKWISENTHVDFLLNFIFLFLFLFNQYIIIIIRM